MDIKAILAKAAKGETLTDAEQAALAAYDPQKALDDAAAAARRKAEERQTEAEAERDVLKKSIAALELKIEEAGNNGKSDLEKALADVEKLTTQMTEHEATIATMTTDAAKQDRQSRVDALVRSANLKFMDGINPDTMPAAFARVFAGLDDADLANETVTGPLVEAFKTANKGVIVNESGHGSGGNGHVGGEGGGEGSKPADKQSTEERAAELRKNR